MFQASLAAVVRVGKLSLRRSPITEHHWDFVRFVEVGTL